MIRVCSKLMWTSRLNDKAIAAIIAKLRICELQSLK